MPQVVTVGAAILGATLVAGTQITVGYVLGSIALSIGISYLSQALLGPSNKNPTFKTGLKLNAISATAPLPIIYGRRLVGGAEKRFLTGSENQYLWRVMTVAEGEIDAIERLDVDGLDADNDQRFAGRWVNRGRGRRYLTDRLVEWTAHLGADDQAADDKLVANISEWTEDHTGGGVAYVAVRLTFNRDAFPSGLPILTALVRGKKLFDPRTGKIEWSDNPALCIRDYLVNPRYGRGIDPALIDGRSIIEAANYCDQTVTITRSDDVLASQKRYICNGVLDPDAASLDNLKQLLTSCRGVLIPPGQQYKLVIDRPEVATAHFEQANILGQWNLSGPSADVVLNRVTARFFNAENKWEEDLSTTESTTFRDQDNGRLLAREIELPFTDSLHRVNILSQHLLKQSRQGWTVQITAPLEALQVEVMDVVTITHPSPGWVRKPFRVTSIELNENDTVGITALEYDSSVYSFDPHAPPETPDTNRPDPFALAPPSTLRLQSGADQNLIATDGTIISRILATWAAPPSAFVERYEIGFKLSASTAWTYFLTDSTEFHLAPVADGHMYDVSVIALYTGGRKSPPIFQTSHPVAGKTEPPEAPASLTFLPQRDGTRQFAWPPNTTDHDLAGYQIRYASALDSPWEKMSPLHTGLLQSSPYQTSQLNAGTYRFAIKSIDTSGNASATARYLVATLQDSPVSTILQAYYPRLEDWPGTIINGRITPVSGDIETTDQNTWDALPPTWDQWTSWIVAGNKLTYQYPDIDLQKDLVFRPIVTAQVAGTATYEIDHAADGGTWTGWQTTITAITARRLRVRIVVTGPAPRIESVAILLEGRQETEDIADLDTSRITGNRRLAVGDIRLPVQRAFTVIKTVQIAFQNTGPGWTMEIIDKKPSGPRIKIYNRAGALADATIDATLKGY